MLSFGPSLTDRNSNQWSKWSVWSNAHLQQKVLKILFWTKSMNMNSWNYLRIPIPYYTQIFGAIRWSSSRFFCQRALSKFTFNKKFYTTWNYYIHISIMFLLLLSYQNCIEPFLESVQCSFFERTSLEFVCYKKFIITVLCGENTPEYSRSCIVVVGHRVPFFGPLKNLFCLDIYIHYLWLDQKGLRSL